MARYLIFPSLSTALDRSAQEAARRGCIGDTDYWWATIQHPTSGQGAVTIQDGGDYDATGLTSDEVAALVPADQMDARWFPQEIA